MSTQIRASRNDDLAVVVDHHGIWSYQDELLLARVFRRFRWDMLTDEALEMLASEYESEAAIRAKIIAENESQAILMREARV